jgi:hypothetical protein
LKVSKPGNSGHVRHRKVAEATTTQSNSSEDLEVRPKSWTITVNLPCRPRQSDPPHDVAEPYPVPTPAFFTRPSM